MTTSVTFRDLESLTNLERLERYEPQIEIRCTDYRYLNIPDGSVVYADPPYKGTNSYGTKKIPFDSGAFADWCLSRPFPVFISEYEMPEGFSVIGSTVRTDSISATATVKRTEKLFVQSKFMDKYKLRIL